MELARRQATALAALFLALALPLDYKLVHAAAAANGAAAAGGAFSSWVAANQQSYALNAALYAKKSAGDGGKTLDASLAATEEKKVTYVVDAAGKGDYVYVVQPPPK